CWHLIQLDVLVIVSLRVDQAERKQYREHAAGDHLPLPRRGHQVAIEKAQKEVPQQLKTGRMSLLQPLPGTLQKSSHAISDSTSHRSEDAADHSARILLLP